MRDPSRSRPALGWLAFVVLLARPAAADPMPVIVDGTPFAPAITTMTGTGLCISSAVSQNPSNEIGITQVNLFNAGINSFIEDHFNDRVTYVQRTVFDLSNNYTQPNKFQAYGDFTNSMFNVCKTGGCDFFKNDDSTSFASRLRGYINITPALVGKSLHFGFYADDAVSFTIYDKTKAHPVLTRAPVLGSPTWRSTNLVSFNNAGLYPVEILYVQITEFAALEMSLFTGQFQDFELPANQNGSLNLKGAGFTLLQPSSFFLTDNGIPPFTNLDKCAQCDRQFANQPGNNGCGPGYYCDGAAVCAPCDSALFCGTSCAPCGMSTPHCVNVNNTFVCAQCRDDGDCGPGAHCMDHLCVQCKCPDGSKCDKNGLCIPCSTVDSCGDLCSPCPKEKPYCVEVNGTQGMKHLCAPCVNDADCPRGQVCTGNMCVPCDTRDHCAGASCNCCAGGSNLKCASLNIGAPPVCVECTRADDCQPGMKCDTVNGRCVGSVPDCNTPDKCGASCVRCPGSDRVGARMQGDRPYCLNGLVCVECRSDLDCGTGRFCLSGECAPCTIDRRCGAKCASCAGDTPFCFSNGTSDGSSCVRCLHNADCAGSGICDGKTHGCTTTCTMPCPMGLWCNGVECVPCYANTHCPCGGSCDLAKSKCSPSCDDNGDCLGTEHCANDRTCKPGRLKMNSDPKGGGPCCGVGGMASSASPTEAREGPGGAAALALVLLLVALEALGRRRARRRA